ncbi:MULTISPECIES: FkbM family methyltransferase [unclassified Paenibacillus]|uniref:FkbM family methyltransferase n=1 Tax=unclassified Paenibacillus TaxID=185978 RepID=UPI001AE38463|nr:MULTISPECIES: FkbM family methyltransferase [unclassified Paenibacillus]MBP1157470.1 FkbM family methyltransferase [Paenibacillus sp. PvP091]MBP1171793.1 FkbM family methyltransferase [Paenibacillus sp. PvR098]MBP2438174.1 FkbM family methyltransferase [Paenibacillus sp. PvP052]
MKFKDEESLYYKGEPIPKQTTSNDPNTYLGEIEKYLNVMIRTQENDAYRYLSSGKKIIGPLIILVKKVIRKLLKWYIEPITSQQTQFNNAVTPAIGRTTELIIGLLNKTSEMEKMQTQYSILETQLQGILNKTSEMEEMQIQYSILETRLQEMLYKIGEMEKMQTQYSNLEKRFQEMEGRMNIYAERIQAASTRLEKIDEIDVFKESNFNLFNKTTYSQSGEDSILAYVVYVLGIPFESVDYIDLGANHAKEMSNTYFFYSKGAKGILVEANPELIPELKFYRHRDIILNNCVDVEAGKQVDFYILSGDGLSTPDIDAAKEFCEINPDLEIIDKRVVSTISYKTIVENYLGKAPTLLSIDIEGKDIEILRSIDYEKYRPLLIVTEVISYDTTLNYNTKNDEVKNFLDSKDYDEYAFTGINSIFLDRKYLRKMKEGQE